MSEKTENPFEKHGEWFAMKQKALEAVLGKMHDLAGSAVLPFTFDTNRGLVDIYYFREGIPGTGFASMHMITEDGGRPLPNEDGRYEFLAFTRLPYIKIDDPMIPFNRIERRTCHLFTSLSVLSTTSILAAGDTCELPRIGEQEPANLVLWNYKPDAREVLIPGHKNSLLLVIEVFGDEMEFAIENGVDALVTRLEEKGFFPYSDLNRPSVFEE